MAPAWQGVWQVWGVNGTLSCRRPHSRAQWRLSAQSPWRPPGSVCGRCGGCVGVASVGCGQQVAVDCCGRLDLGAGDATWLWHKVRHNGCADHEHAPSVKSSSGPLTHISYQSRQRKPRTHNQKT
eukprot:303633-Chlamydomonas_euryale.AAC.3